MKALSIQQPWAQLIVEGLKDVENRTWPTRERGQILVHAGKRVDKDGYLWLLNNWYKLGVPGAVGDLLDRYRSRPFPTGGIVGTVEITGCVSDSASPWAAAGAWHFTLRDGRPMPLRRGDDDQPRLRTHVPHPRYGAIVTPQRIVLSRRKGWRMPPNTVKVDRTTRWGNPFYRHGDGYRMHPDNAVACFRAMIEKEQGFIARISGQGSMLTTVEDIRRDLRGKNLACWCALGQPCHADVLLELANA